MCLEARPTNRTDLAMKFKRVRCLSEPPPLQYLSPRYERALQQSLIEIDTGHLQVGTYLLCRSDGRHIYTNIL